MIASPTFANKVQIPFISLMPFLLIALGLEWGDPSFVHLSS
jgi:hypothetical protein